MDQDRPPRVVAIDDEDAFLRLLAQLAGRWKWELRAFASGAAALDALEGAAGDADAVLTDLHMPGMDGLELLGAVGVRWPDLSVVLMTGAGTVESAVRAMKQGAYDYLSKPFDSAAQVEAVLRRAVERTRLLRRSRLLERGAGVAGRFGGATSPRMREMLGLVEAVAGTDVTVLVAGESGTGKELVARSIHERSARSARPFVAVNCSGLTPGLLESELFGHARGAFTGAVGARRGLFEEAEGGTLFLDEVGEIPLELQARLLRAIQEREVRAVGSNVTRRIDLRLVAATNRDLRAAVGSGAFREDLYYRLNVVRIETPPLRDRLEDLPELAYELLRRHAGRAGRPVIRFAPSVLDAFAAYSWPGNVRELENVVQRAVVVARGDTVTQDALPRELRGSKGPTRRSAPFAEAKTLAIDAFERGYAQRVLAENDGIVSRAARAAGLEKSNFRRLLRRHGIRAGRPPAAG